LQSERIYSAPSLREVAQQLLMYRLTGVLTLWRAAASRQDTVRMTVEHGRLTRVFWAAAYQEDINEAILEWLNTWGEIHFSFLSTESRLALPPPSQQTQPSQPSFPQSSNTMPTGFPRRAAETRPLGALPPKNRNTSSLTGKMGAVNRNSPNISQNPQTPQIQESGQAYATNQGQSSQRPESVVASLTTHGQNYPAISLPRYERTIFLLINGRRSVVDLAQLTKRSPDEVFTTLYRLSQMQLITINTLP